MIAPPESFVYEFDEFRVDPLKRRLLRNGEVVPLTPKAFSILLVLLEHRGEVVEKRDLVAQVWPDTHVSDANLTQNVSALRKALGERAGEGRYIVTVPGRGYRFTADVALLEKVPTGSFSLPELPAASSPGEAKSRALEPDLPPEPQPDRVRRRLRPPPAMRLALGLALAVVSLFGFQRLRSPAPAEVEAGSVAPDRRTLAVLGFSNLSSDGSADWLAPVLTEMLTTELAAGARMRVVSHEKVEQVRQSLPPRAPDILAGLDPEGLYSRLGAELVVVGSYLSLPAGKGRRIRLDVRVRKLPSGDTAAVLSQVGDEAALFALVSGSGMGLRQALGISELSPVQQRAMRALHPATAEAARLYTQGLVRLRRSDPLAARDLLSSAVRADPASAPIRSALAKAWSELGYEARAVEEARRAVELSGPLSRGEALAIEARFQEVSKRWDDASRTYRSLWTFFPDDLEYGLHLVMALMNAGRGAEALEVIAELRRLPPPAGTDARIDLTEARTARRLSDFVTERRAAQRAAAKALRSGETIVRAQALIFQGDALLQMGSGEAAAGMFREAWELGMRAKHQWTVGMALANLGLALQSLGDLDGAMQAQEEAFAIARSLGAAAATAAQYHELGQLHQSRGDLNNALSLLEESLEFFGRVEDRLMQARTLSRIGSILSLRGDLAGARRRFGQAAALGRKVGSRVDEARALAGLGTALSLAGDLEGARLELRNALQILGDTEKGAIPAAAVAAEIRLELGRLSLTEGDTAAGARLAGEVAFPSRTPPGPRAQARALALFAEALLRQGNLTEARKAADQARALAEKSESLELSLAVAPALARIDAAGGGAETAIVQLRQALSEAERRGFVQSAFEIRLALGEVQLRHEDPAAGRATLRDLERQSAARGYQRLAREAAAAVSRAVRGPVRNG